ncbi:pentapeptide repeat-containing protein [Gloeomargaritales cyanobacterium VI4D9]|nr:pentapeptide repeat-containing protein [Gloeomargaritales cyanobacterium VI4D9]
MTPPLESDEFLARYAEGERDFSGSNLTKLMLVQAHVPGLNLTNADLTGAIFYMGNLAGSCFQGACLRNGNFYRAQMYRSDFTEAVGFEESPGEI